ncbi:MAG: SusC/RagA family TonB-linked outer membrane protein [Cytophagia bacterium]|nr:MAG: SusC/RagA family TonB-linked outer membrane protein [Runella sp.]TAG23516.1 MAG: SusC/RagA family TonB-linked outer membrane protein [Cytophagales bacterium]TAG42711.1 MAG: SusC/RagA family TonB-linked outer membrane protein [Cytophagia bacterium]TAG76344.1 MAG: SusC/RagA family TonB-linked outer membrane protein [Cytophagales bacterium]
MKKQLLHSIFWLVVLALPSMAQERQITGKATTANGTQPLPGVSVVVKGTARGTTTDVEGTYKVAAAPGTTLIFSYIGFARREVKVGNSNVIDVELTEDDNTLNEVVVTGLNMSQEKRGLGYAVQVVKGQELLDSQRDNFMLGLQGRVAGLQMTPTSGTAGGSAVIQLRGAGSIGGNNQPLYVVDGLPISNSTFGQGSLVSDRSNRDMDYQNRAADINPNDIETITILKGPEAAALYGIEAANGAIVITTKKGGIGRGTISYNGSMSVRDVYRFPKTQTQYGRGFNGVFNPNNFSYFGADIREIGEGGGQVYDNVGNFFEQGMRQSHNLTMDGGSEKATYRLSTTYVSDKGVVPTNKMEQINIRLTGTAQITPKLKTTTSFNYIGTNSVLPLRGALGFLIGTLAFPFYLDAQNYLTPDGRRFRTFGEDNNDLDNPFFNIYKNINGNRNNRTISNIQLDYKPTSWLNLAAILGADIFSTRLNRFQHPESNAGITPKGFVENATENSQLLNANIRATATKDFGKFQTSLTIGSSVEDRRYETTSIYGEQVYLPDFNSINNTLPTTQRNKGTLIQRRLVGVFGTVNLSYNAMLFLTVQGRNDWSSTLPTQNNSFFYPSVSAGFVFTELPMFEKHQNILSYGKLRAAYAEVGNDAVPYRTRPRLVPQGTTGGGFLYDFFGGNENLRPERTESFEVGTELKFFKNRVGLDITYFKKRSFDQITSQRLSYGTGFIFGLLNGGEIRNSGLEVQMNLSPIKAKNVQWDMNLNFTKLWNQVVNLPGDVAEYYDASTWLFGNVRASAMAPNQASYYPNLIPVGTEGSKAIPVRGEGKTTAIAGWGYLRNNNGDILISPSTGLPLSNATFLPIGDRNSDFTLGFQNTISYKSWSLSVLLDIRKGGDVFNGNEMFMFRSGLSTRVLDRSTPYTFQGVLRDGRENSDTPTPNTIQITPQFRSDFYGSSGFAEESFIERDINWVRLRDLSLRYTLPQSVLSKQKIFRTASVFLSGNELFLLTNYTGADPDVNGTGAGTLGIGAGGFDYGTLALPRTLTAGMRFSF